LTRAPRPQRQFRARPPRFRRVVDVAADGSEVAQTRYEYGLSHLKRKYESAYSSYLKTPEPRVKLPFLVFLGIGRRWDGPTPAGKACPICAGRFLRGLEYCLLCDRFARDAPAARPPRKPQRVPLRPPKSASRKRA
jgi:hypothetical protein